MQPGAPQRPRRNLGPIIAVIVIIIVVLGAAGGYLVGGYAFAQSRLNKAHDAYNTTVDHQNKLNDAVNSLNSTVTGSTGSSAAAKTQLDQVVSLSQAAQTQIGTDDAALAAADGGLTENQWLTVFSRSSLDQASKRIGHERAALALAKSITADYVLIGGFYQAFYDTANDVGTLGTKASASDYSGAASANQTLKTDVAKAIQQDQAPGLPAEIDTYLKDIQSFSGNFGAVLNAIVAGDTKALTTATTALEADASKIQGFDLSKMDTEVGSYYQPLIDQYNAEIDKANKT
jgi:hypothetical protein